MVSGLNHAMHDGFLKSKPKYTFRDYKTDANGKVTSEKLVYFKNNHKEGLMYAQAVSEPLVDNTLSVYGHGNTHFFNGVHDTEGIDSMLYNDSVMYQNFVTNGGQLTMYLKSCNTGNYSEGGYRTISEDLSQMRNRLIIHAPAAFWLKDGSIQNKAGYNMFMNGAKVGWDLKL